LAPFIAGRTVIRDDLGQAYSAGTLRLQGLSAIEGVRASGCISLSKGRPPCCVSSVASGALPQSDVPIFGAFGLGAEIDRSLFFGLFFSPLRAWSSGPISTTTFVGLRVSGHDQWDFL
jgi:hypothetical protein